MNYKQTIYNHYRSAFKGVSTETSLHFVATKLKPILYPWVKQIDSNLPIVDLGCGAGELLLAFQELGFNNLLGCDFSSEQVNIANKIFPHVIEADLFNFIKSFDDSSLGLVTAFDVIEHLTRQETFDLMKIIYNKLRPGGSIIIHLPNGLSPFVGHVFWSDLTHEFCMTPESALTLCKIHGFEDFDCVEHLGAGNNLKGKIRKLAWFIIRSSLKVLNMIETGNSNTNIWTRNFAFKAVKPLLEKMEIQKNE